MTTTDTISDMLTRIRNAQMRQKSKLIAPASKLQAAVLAVLAAEGYIGGYSVTDLTGGKKQLEIELKYYDSKPVIKEIKRISRPGCRVYADAKKIPKCAGGLGITILSTSKGVMSDADARNQNVGGEVMCSVF